MRAYSLDLRKRVLAAYQKGDSTLNEIAERFSVSRSFIVKLAKRYRETGTLQPKPHRGGRVKTVDPDALVTLYREDNDAVLREFQTRLKERYGITASISSIDRAFRRLGITRKKRASTPESET